MFNSKIINQFAKLDTPFYYYDMELLSETIESVLREASKKIVAQFEHTVIIRDKIEILTL